MVGFPTFAQQTYHLQVLSMDTLGTYHEMTSDRLTIHDSRYIRYSAPTQYHEIRHMRTCYVISSVTPDNELYL